MTRSRRSWLWRGARLLVAVLATYTAMLDIREVLVGGRSTRVEDDVQ